MTELTHTLLAIHVNEPDSCPLAEGHYIDDAQGNPFAFASQSPEHARLIVRAVNCHDALVDALEGIIRVSDKRLVGKGRPHSNDVAWVRDEIDKARAALAAVEEDV